ncbi:prolyl oligopeptidase family serine peptidase [Parasphingorhabdus sp.]|uniref:alpha/beta hydrolase family protein n=1 Tax=Parasphingorhabdus sp. TaxID=2709688 RepID=UPI003263A81D
MKKRHLFAGIVAVLAVGVGATAYVITPTVHAGQTGEAPELGRTGVYAVGTVAKNFTLTNRQRITGWGALTGNLESADRNLSVRFWFPAKAGSTDETAQYVHSMNLPGKDPFDIVSSGYAHADAEALEGEKFPLVLMSHGYGGWNSQFSNLGEHLASRGYVVASIHHGDAPVDGVTSAILSFGNVLVDRTLDQRQILTQILENTKSASTGYSALIDPQTVGLIGYSMGGYGAIASAGAPYVYENSPMSNIPEVAQAQLQEISKEPAPIKALVTFAPWGGQPDNRAWSAENLSKIHAPVLLISGNQDDVVNYEEGVKWLHASLTGTERYMLVYREARHNIVGNDFDVQSDFAFSAIEFLKEPVWRSDRLNAINQHFVTAFLDWKLKGQEDKADYLNVPTVDSNKGNWPVGFGEQLNGKLAGSEEQDFWKGFQRRWAAGLEMHHAVAGE